jgi:hypothetical protein
LIARNTFLTAATHCGKYGTGKKTPTAYICATIPFLSKALLKWSCRDDFVIGKLGDLGIA